MKKCDCEILRIYCCREVSFLYKNEVKDEMYEYIEDCLSSKHQEDISNATLDGYIDSLGEYGLSNYCVFCGKKINENILDELWKKASNEYENNI